MIVRDKIKSQIPNPIPTKSGQISKRWLILWAASFCFLCSSFSETKDDGGYEVIASRLSLQLFPGSNGLICIDSLSIRTTAGKVEHLDISLVPVFDVDYVSVDGNKKNFKRKNDIIELDDTPSDSQFVAVVSYSGELSFRSEFTGMTAERAVLREEEVLPHGPGNMGFARLSITVPREWNVVAVGRLVAQISQHDSTTFVYESNETLPAIGWICAGKYVKEQSSGVVPLSSYLFSADSGSAGKVLKLAENVLNFYGKKFSQYRFPKFSIVEVENWVAGRNVLAIAAPSFIMVKRLAFETSDAFNQASAILPHEIAHQWWPLTVFLNDEDLPFLAEGMCEYSAKLYDEASGTTTVRDSLNRHPLLHPLISRIAKGKDVPLHQKTDLRSLTTHYLKASYVHNMLRQLLGDSTFFLLYHEFARRFDTKQARLDDFQKLAEELSGKKLNWFFNQWVYGKGIPRMKIYNVKATTRNTRWDVRGRIRILGYDKFTTFVDVGVQTSSGVTTTRVWLGDDSSGIYHNDVPFELVTQERPVRAILDPKGDVLKMQELPSKFGDLRDPSDGVLIVGTMEHADHLLALARKDSTAMEDAGWSLTIKPDTTVTLLDLQNERVFLYGKISENKVVNNLQTKFPIGFPNDTLIINNEPIFDSSLALLQIIVNPFSEEGLLCWIAPFSEKADPSFLPFDASWVLARGKEVISSGTWEVSDSDLEKEIR